MRKESNKREGEGEKKEREKEAEGKGRNIKANEEKTSTFPLQLLPSGYPFFIPVWFSFYPICFPNLCTLLFTYPPELHLCLEHTVTIKDNVDMKLREKNYKGSNNLRRSEQVIMIENQVRSMIYHPGRQS